MIKTLKMLSSLILITLLTACACSSCAPAPNIEKMLSQPQASFFKNMLKLCGKTFVGETVYPEDPDHDFAGKKLIADFDTCHNRYMKIPFQVGEDESRTWIIVATYQGLLLKHDHRYPDGKRHDITNYGGYAAAYKGDIGSANTQYFLADEDTAKMLPEAKTNVWMLAYDEEKKQLTYYLERHGKPRYKAVLKMVKD